MAVLTIFMLMVVLIILYCKCHIVKIQLNGSSEISLNMVKII